MTDWEQAHLDHVRREWDQAAATFDQAPDHGLRDPVVRQAWAALLRPYLPTRVAPCLDIGCGTGSLSLLLAEAGQQVTGIDLSPAMVAQARQKAALAGQAIAFTVMEASNPAFPPAHFALILCRHLLWALPEPAQVLAHWAKLLQPGGRLLLIEGFWHTGSGLPTAAVIAALPPALDAVKVVNLVDQPALWGGPVQDERYLVVAERRKELR